MKTCIYFIKIFFLILFNDILDVSMWLGVRIKKILIYIFNACKKVVVKIIHGLIIILKALKYIIITLIKFLVEAIKYIAFVISDVYINLKYKLFISYLKHKEKPQKYPELYKGEEIIEDTTPEVEEEKIEETIDKITEEIPEDTSKDVEIIEEEKSKEESIEEIDKTTDEDIEEITEVIKTKKISISKIIKGIFVLFTWLLALSISLGCLIVAENTILAVDLNRPFLYNIDILTRDQAILLIFIGTFFSLITIGEFLVFLGRFITCRPILQKRWFSDFTTALIFSYFSGMCLVGIEEIHTSLENNTIKNIQYMSTLEKVLPFLAIICFIYGTIKLIMACESIFHRDEI